MPSLTNFKLTYQNKKAILNNWIEDKTSMVSLPPAAESSNSVKSADVILNSDDEIDEDDDISLEEEEMERIKEKVRHEMEKKRIARKFLYVYLIYRQ